MTYYNLCGIRSKHTNISKGKGGTYKNSLVCQTPIVKVDTNKYLTLNRCPLGNYELKKHKEQIRSDSFLLITKFWQGNFRQVAKHCFELSPLTSSRNPPLLSAVSHFSLFYLVIATFFTLLFIVYYNFAIHIFSSLLILNVFRWKYIFACLLSSTVQFCQILLG